MQPAVRSLAHVHRLSGQEYTSIVTEIQHPVADLTAADSTAWIVAESQPWVIRTINRPDSTTPRIFQRSHTPPCSGRDDYSQQFFALGNNSIIVRHLEAHNHALNDRERLGCGGMRGRLRQ
jgi:hypothetical protein